MTGRGAGSEPTLQLQDGAVWKWGEKLQALHLLSKTARGKARAFMHRHVHCLYHRPAQHLRLKRITMLYSLVLNVRICMFISVHNRNSSTPCCGDTCMGFAEILGAVYLAMPPSEVIVEHVLPCPNRRSHTYAGGTCFPG
jgi:hypothetical protein